MGENANATDLRQLQLQELNILKEVKRICEANKLRYYLTAGTLLGAIRHKGFIPWDDDIDVVMPRADFDCFARICKTELKSDFFYQDCKTDKQYPFFFSKIRLNNTEVNEQILKNLTIHKGTYIDIFSLDVCPNCDWTASLLFKLIRMLTCAYIGRIDKSYLCGYNKWYAILLYKFFKSFPCSVIDSLRTCFAKLPAVFNSGTRLCTFDGTHDYPAETYSANWFDDQTILSFEGNSFPGPSGWQELLSNMYGDYMSIPADENRATHFTEYYTDKEKMK